MIVGILAFALVFVEVSSFSFSRSSSGQNRTERI